MAQATKKGYHKGSFGSATLADRRAATKRREFASWQAARKEQMRRQRELAKRRVEKKQGWFRRVIERIRSWFR